MTLTAIIAIIAYTISALALSAIALSQNRRVYRPSILFRAVLLFTAIAMLGMSLGYIAILMEYGDRLTIQAYYLRPAATWISVAFAGMAIYTLQQASAYEDMRQEFIQTAAHELRTPLTIIWGFADILTERFDELPTPALQQYLSMIHRQTGILGGHIQDILAFEKGRHNDLLPPEAVDLKFLVDERVETIREAIAKPAGVTITIDHLADVTVMGHTDKLRLIINNLLVNAVKFSPPANSGGTVEVGLYTIGDTAVIAIRDTGVGISPAFMPLLFEPFQQERRDVKRPFGGMGIGLAAAASMVKSQGGRIEVQSELGKGSTFRVILPLGAM